MIDLRERPLMDSIREIMARYQIEEWALTSHPGDPCWQNILRTKNKCPEAIREIEELLRRNIPVLSEYKIKWEELK